MTALWRKARETAWFPNRKTRVFRAVFLQENMAENARFPLGVVR